MKRIWLPLLAIVVLLLACGKSSDTKAELKKLPIAVKATRVKRGDFIKTLNYKGTVFPWRSQNIAPNTSGRIAGIYKKPGDLVKKGELLAELDTTTLKLQLNQAQAALEVARASHKDASLNLNRLEKLYEKKAISKLQLEKAQLHLEATVNQHKSADANLNVIKHTLDNSYMRASFEGIITSKNMEEGDMINPLMGMGVSQPIMTLMDLKNIKVIVDVPSEDIEKIQIGQKCRVKISSASKDIFKGEIYSKNLAADPISKTFKVEVKVRNYDIKIKAGIFAEIAVEILNKQSVLILPSQAIIDNDYVVLYEEGRAKIIQVLIGDSNTKEYEIVSGLSEGDLIVIEGNYDLKDGAVITLSGEEN